MVLYFLKKYPFSITVILLVIYLSFFKPPTVDLPLFAGFDKLMHICMYAGLSGMLWLEFLLNYRRKPLPMRHAYIGAIAAPILFGGLIEIGQEYLTTYRGGDWLDFLADIGGVVPGSLFAWYILRPWIIKKAK
ncbi:membrane protein [Bacteroidia bacterium]|nr:membrane protein [Bacteroidia bacterium]GHU77827.1 membrane protein [Bacteroidia bacterium]